MDDLTSERLKELFSYEAETGRLCRRKSTPGCGRKAGTPIGVDNGAGWARITTSGAQRHLGLFADKEAASNAYLEAKRAIHAGCTV